jgi:diadenosine tetraphosphate (Ap4A) HIT family hydrolase
MPTLIHQRVREARAGTNPTVIRRMKTGWLVIGDNQIVRGYCVLLSDPTARDINALPMAERAEFLLDMSLAGDALLEATGARLINYEILGNKDRALHVHLHPRYEDERPERKFIPVWEYYKDPPMPVDLSRDRAMMDQIGAALDRLMTASGRTA